jgi:hypothetical protein
MNLPASNWLNHRRHRLFVRRCTAHLCDRRLRDHLQARILHSIQRKEDAGLSVQLDSRFPLQVNEQDLDDSRIELILDRLNGILYLDDNIFEPGLERKLMLSHQLSRKHFGWKSLPARAPVSIRFIDAGIGFGVFAERDLSEGELIGEYTGMVLSETEGEDFSYLHAYPSLKWGEEELLLAVDALRMGNETRFINHSDAGGVSHMEDYFFNGHWHILYKVGSLVGKGEQLFVNYGEGYWTGQPAYPVSLSP